MSTQSISFVYSKKVFILAGMIVFFFFFVSCKDKNPEQKEYDSLTSGLKYKSYKTLSENSIPPLILLYNTTNHPDNLEISESILRLLLGYSWAVNERPDYAIAESNIILDISSDDKDMKLLSHSLAAISLYEKGWKTLAADESKIGSALLNRVPISKGTQLKIMTFNMILGTLCIYEENYQSARFYFAEFSIASGINWPYLIADAMADIKEGKLKQGLKKIKIIIKKKDVPDSVRKALSETLTKAETPAVSVDSKLFWNHNTSIALYNGLKNSSILGIDKITDLLDNLVRKLELE